MCPFQHGVQMDLSIQAYVHVGDKTYLKNSLFNAVCDVIEDSESRDGVD
jgi:hypothetical protein